VLAETGSGRCLLIDSAGGVANRYLKRDRRRRAGGVEDFHCCYSWLSVAVVSRRFCGRVRW